MINKITSPLLSVGGEIVYFDEIDSTNLEAARQAKAGAGAGLVIVAGKQTSGRGRRGRNWASEEKQDIYMSLLLRPSFSPDIAPMLTLIQALAVRKALEEVSETVTSRIKVSIKWPNDIYIKGKKVCGILTEMVPENGRISYVIIGTGINVNRRNFPKELEEIATSLYLETGREIKKEEIIDNINRYFQEYYDVFLKTKDLSYLKEEYNTYLINKDREVRVLDPSGEFTGFGLGITSYGELLVKRNDDETVKIASGEVSIR